MRRITLAVAAAVLSFGATGTVSAQDILRSLRSPVPINSWTGFYLGGNVGYGWAKASSTGSPIASASSFTMKGMNGGLQLGYNIQSDRLVFGVETDIQGSLQKSDGPGNVAAIFGAAGVGGFPLSETDKITWYGTTRARVGAAVDQVLIYGTGGVAYGNFRYVSSFGSGVSYSTYDQTPVRFGWTAGGGVEAMLSRNWTVKVEYLHLDFGGYTESFIVNGSIPVDLHTKLTNDVVRVGVNYIFR